jgi:hypothetical protein
MLTPLQYYYSLIMLMPLQQCQQEFAIFLEAALESIEWLGSLLYRNTSLRSAARAGKPAAGPHGKAHVGAARAAVATTAAAANLGETG